MEIPTKLTERQFQVHIEPGLSKAKRGYVSREPLYKIFNYMLYKLYTGCQWEELPIERKADGQPEMSWQTPRYHFYKWSRDGSLQRLFEAGILTIKYELNLSKISIDGSQTVAKKGEKASPIKSGRKRRPVTLFPPSTLTDTLSA
jgi:transposase